MSKSGKQRRRQARAPRAPVVAPGGIRAQNLRNLKARPWWARRWLEALEAFALGSRLGRGRAYAASGQVRELHIAPGLVSARVQGAESQPYATEIQFHVAGPETLETLAREMRGNPVWAARLVSRDFPSELEALFNTQGIPLFPRRENDLVMRCTCRDWGKPCKHLAALFYIMAEAVERDPRLLLVLRGVRVDGDSGNNSREPLRASAPPREIFQE
ncbi:MAG: SWIM zinc finger family protein, partial [Kiritimatiellaeota bacterium]|nr:SWIM zinc finger family protein [Kiritimatiellota bacterium]